MGNIRHTLAENLRIYRKNAGLSQEKLGELCGLHRTYIGGIEQQTINVCIENIGKIALALNIDPVLLFVQPPQNNDVPSAETKLKKKNKIPEPCLKPGGYALCTWEGDSVVISPLHTDNLDLAVSILVSLIQHGHTDDLMETFEKIQAKIIQLTSENKRKPSKKS